MTSPLKAWLFAACAIAGFGCTDDANPTQLLTGRISTRDAIAVRAIDGTTIITASRVRSDGSFTLQLPAGHHYRLEVLTAGGVHNVVHKSGALGDLAFEVCQPSDPFDMGGLGEPDQGMGGGGGGSGGGGCDPTDPNCGMPWPCDPTTDPMCKPPCDPTDPNDPWCGGGGGGGGCDPTTDPTCGWPCDPMTDPNCGWPCDPMDPTCGTCKPGDPNCVPPCDPTSDGTCPPPPPPPQCDPGDPNCPVCSDDTDPNCKCDWWMGTCEPVPPCDPVVDAMCPTPPPPCDDPMDPNTCKDPCMADPQNCGCTMPVNPDGTVMGGNGGTDAGNGGSDPGSCWPLPEPCTMQSCPDDPWAPENPPTDFGCEDGTT